MCGFAGLLNPQTDQPKDWYVSRIEPMTNAIRHRGPDDSGFWYDPSVGLGFGFRRLSILDLSVNGKQPMQSACGRYVLMLNGEIYNHSDLKKEILTSELFPFSFRGHSDTEVLLAAITAWGLDSTLPKLNGMFAIALWDKEKKNLFLCRDRMGEKPLYYGWVDNHFVFSSELKSLVSLPGFLNPLDKKSLNLFFRHSCIPAPYSVFENIFKLPPASLLKFDPTNPRTVKANPYWVIPKPTSSSSVSFEEAEEKLHSLLIDSVKIRMEADVPLGAFLSGGIDSSVILSIMQDQSSRPIKTFTIGFEEANFNEASFALDIARQLGTEHTELTVTSQEAQTVIPLLNKMMDEPFSDASIIPTYLVSKLAREKVTVSLSGDGGDELFSGYDRYLWGDLFWKRFGKTHRWIKNPLAHFMNLIPTTAWNNTYQLFEPVLPKKFHWEAPGEKFKKLSEVLGAKNFFDFYTILTSHFNPPSLITLQNEEYPKKSMEELDLIETDSIAPQMMSLDLVGFLPDDILVKVDRATMAVSLEGRMPLLDHRIVEFAQMLPLDFKMRRGETKLILKKILGHYLPPHLFERPKKGFSVPVGTWIRGPLKDWAEELLSESKLKDQGFLRPQLVHQLWKEHLTGKRNWQNQLWDILMFQNWLSNWNS